MLARQTFRLPEHQRAFIALDRKQIALHLGFGLLARFMRQCGLVVGFVAIRGRARRSARLVQPCDQRDRVRRLSERKCRMLRAMNLRLSASALATRSARHARSAVTPMAHPASPMPRSARASAAWRRHSETVRTGCDANRLAARDRVGASARSRRGRPRPSAASAVGFVRPPARSRVAVHHAATSRRQPAHRDAACHAAVRTSLRSLSRSRSAVTFARCLLAATTRGSVGGKLKPKSCG